MTGTIERKLLATKCEIESLGYGRVISPGPEEYVGSFGIIGRGDYGRLNPGLHASEAQFQDGGANLVALFNRYLALSLLHTFDPLAGSCRLPASVVLLYERDLVRIERQLDEQPDEFYRLGNDAFVKDLAILSHRLIPVGAEYALPESGVPRSLLFRRGPAQFFRCLRVCMFQCGGFSPYFELHAHVLALEDFNPDGWLDTYMCLAELLELNPAYKGITSSSWFLDPALARVSPRLSYLQEIPSAHGATLLFSGYDASGETGALARSVSRRRLYEKGEYVPAIYTRVWPRKELIGWRKQRHGALLN